MTTGPHDDAFRSRWTPDADIPLSGVPTGATWRRARNLATGEAVILFTVTGHAALEVADAARRAYLVEDARLMPVQDVQLFGDPREDEDEGAEGDADPEPMAVVEYPVPPAAPLAALFADGPLRGETARSIIGEIAAGLDVARRRGIRHQNLDSNRVFVDASAGTVHILGVGVEAAARTEEFDSGRVASFRDTTSLVALLYKALTGMRPVRERDGLVPRASTVSPRRVPEDLDLLCDVVLNETADAIPETVRDLAAELGPWQSIPVTLEAYDPQDAEIAASQDREDAEAAAAEARSEAPEGASAPHDAADPEATAALRPVEEGEPLDPEAVEGEQGSDEEPARPGAPMGLAGASALATGGAVAGLTTVGSSRVEASADVSQDEPSGDASPVPSTAAAQDHDDAAEVPSSASEPVAAPGGNSGDQARTLIRELHLDERRRGSAFPGHLDVQPTAPNPAPDQDPEVSADPERTATLASVPTADDEPRTAPMAPIIAGAGVVAVGGASAAAADAPSGVGRSENADVPPEDASNSPEQPTLPHAPIPPATGAMAPTAVSAPTPSSAEDSEEGDGHDVSTAASEAGSDPDAPREPTGPIVIHGRDRSLTEAEAAEAETGRGSLLRDVVGVAMDRDESTAYAQAPVQREERSRAAQWVLAAAVLLVLIALVFAITSITSTVRGGGSAPVGSTAEETSAAAEEEAAAEESPAAEEAEDLPAPTPASAEIFHRGSDNEPDHTEEAGNLTDGDAGTTWRTKIYASSEYGGLKEGTGIRIAFEEPGTLTSLVVTTAESTGGVLELRSAGDGDELGEVLATGEFTGDGEVTLTPESPLTEVEAVTLWIPELPEDSGADGFRARIAEVRAE